MKMFLSLLALTGPICAQFIEPSWRGREMTTHAEWDVFTEAKFDPNSPDVATDDATLICTTSSAFLTSSGNIYSFQSPTFFQIDDRSDFPIGNFFLQISALGSGVDVQGARVIATNSEGQTVAIAPERTFITSEEELTGENGGIGTTYGIQWDLSGIALRGEYSILFNATESSLSLGRVSLDAAVDYEVIAKPKPLTLKHEGDEIVVSWFGRRTLQSSVSLEGEWQDVPGALGANEIRLPLSQQATFFRLKQPVVTE